MIVDVNKPPKGFSILKSEYSVIMRPKTEYFVRTNKETIQSDFGKSCVVPERKRFLLQAFYASTLDFVFHAQTTLADELEIPDGFRTFGNTWYFKPEDIDSDTITDTFK